MGYFPHQWERHASYWMVPSEIPSKRLRRSSLWRSITLSPACKSSIVSKDVTSRFWMFHAVRTGYLWSLVKLPGARLRLKLHRTRVALAPHPMSGGGGDEKDQVGSWQVTDWRDVGAHLAWRLHWSVRRSCTLLGWLQISVTILLSVWKLPFLIAKENINTCYQQTAKLEADQRESCPLLTPVQNILHAWNFHRSQEVSSVSN